MDAEHSKSPSKNIVELQIWYKNKTKKYPMQNKQPIHELEPSSNILRELGSIYKLLHYDKKCEIEQLKYIF